MTMNAVQAFEKIQSRAEEIKTDDTQQFPETANAGDFWRQGDVYVTLLSAVPAGCQEINGRLQVAEGKTQGARHCLDSLGGVTMYRARNGDALSGPIVDLTERRTLCHPEHGDLILPAGTYSISYQRAFAEELRRVAD